ncbi:MAG: hypothetical protein ACXWP5_00625 [Bdellovibrionota bacterium]
MTRKLSGILCVTLIGGWIFGFGGCTTAEVSPISAPLPPNYIRASHPLGYTSSDLEATFTQKDAPTLESLATCDSDFFKLKKVTLSVDEYKTGIRQLVRQDPLTYHWCFYGKILTLQNQLKEMTYIDDKQKLVLQTFEFLVPVARVFQVEFSETRYLRWAVAQYRQISEAVFYRKLELTPRTTADLVDAYNPFGLWREPQGPRDVLDKYNLGTNATPPLKIGSQTPPTAPVAAVSSVPTPVETFSAAPRPAETTAAAPAPVQTVAPLAKEGMMDAPPLPPAKVEQSAAKPAPAETFVAKPPDAAPAPAPAEPARAPAAAAPEAKPLDKTGPTEAILQDDTVTPTN